MLKFKEFIREQKEEFGHLKHLEHAEDHPIHDGEVGFQHAADTLGAAHKAMRGEHDSKITVKYDGAPAVIFGKHPKTGRFFVGSKSVFNKEPKINYTAADVDRNHGHAPGLAQKLKHSLKHLKKIAPKSGVYQGDLMYTRDGKVSDDIHDHNDQYHFTPNTITYSVDKNHPEGKKISKAKIGVVVHTQYHGTNLENMRAKFEPDTHNFNTHDDVHVIDHKLDLQNVEHPSEHQRYHEHHMELANDHHRRGGEAMHGAIKPHRTNLAMYMNHCVRTGEQPSTKRFIQHITRRHQTAMQKFSPKTVKAKTDTHKQNVAHIKSNSDHFDNFFKMHGHLQNAKDSLVRSLNHTVSKHLPYRHSIAGKPSDPEGYVITHKGHPTKLVNRSEFAKHNFMKGKPQT